MDDIHKLSYWLNKSKKEIVQVVLQKGEREIDKKELSDSYQQYFNYIENDISQRDSCFKLYTNLINPKDDFLKEENHRIEINNQTVIYHEVRHQLFISLLILNTRLYEQCFILCYCLYNLKYPEKFLKPSDILSKKFYENFQNISSKNEIEELKYNYGYYLDIILFFRNDFVHFGEYLNKTENFFISKNVEDKDTLNLDVTKKAYQKRKKSNIPYSKQYFNLSETNENKAGQIIKKCMDISDHYMGSLINHILKLRWMDNLPTNKSNKN